MNEIAKFSILDENEIHNFGQNLDKKWPTDCQKKLSNSFTFIVLLQLGWKNAMPRIIGMD